MSRAALLVTCLVDLFYPDIELTLTRGVHGPKEVHAVFVDSL